MYKHGENQALTVSQNVVFKDIQRDGSGNITSQDIIPIQRNHLYKVILTPKYNNGALVFDAIDYAIQVVDWQNGETIVFAGDDNLTAQSTPSFTVTGAHSLRGAESDGKTNPTLIYTGVDEHSIYLTVTSATTGTMLESTTFPSNQYGPVSSATTNDDAGNLVETYKIDIDDNIPNNVDYTFTLSNAINTSLSRTFVLKKRPKLPIEYFAAGNLKTTKNTTTNQWEYEMLPARTIVQNNMNGTGGAGKDTYALAWNSEQMTAPQSGITFKNDNSGQEYRVPTVYEWAFVAVQNPSDARAICQTGSGYINGTTERVPLEYPSSSNLINVKSYYDVVGSIPTPYQSFTHVIYAIKFEEETITHNLYRCAYRYRLEVAGNTTASSGSGTIATGYWVVDVVYIGDNTNIDLAYIKNASNSSMWDNPDATLVLPAFAAGHCHYHSSTIGSNNYNQSVVLNLGYYIDSAPNVNSWCYNTSTTYFFVRLIEKH